MAINLLPWREQQAIQRNYRYGLWLLISIGCLALITVGICRYLNLLKIHYEKENIQLAQQIIALHLPNDTQKLTADYQSVQQQIQLIRRIQTQQTQFWREISWLQQQSPSDIQLTHLTWTTMSLRLQATTAYPDRVGLLVSALEKSQLFSQVILENIDQTGHSTMTYFSIHANRIQEFSI